MSPRIGRNCMPPRGGTARHRPQLRASKSRPLARRTNIAPHMVQRHAGRAALQVQGAGQERGFAGLSRELGIAAVPLPVSQRGMPRRSRMPTTCSNSLVAALVPHVVLSSGCVSDNLPMVEVHAPHSHCGARPLLPRTVATCVPSDSDPASRSTSSRSSSGGGRGPIRGERR